MSPPNIRIVLVGARHPGNIGAVARAMKTMSLTQLYLVRPEDFPSLEAERRAVGAADILHAAQVVDEVADAVADCKLVLGGTARSREISHGVLTVREAGSLLVRETAAGDPAAVLFGSERNGLSNRELDGCSYHLQIPTNPDFSSLNLAAAVQLVAYEIFMASHETPVSEPNPSPYPSQEDLEFFYKTLDATLTERQFYTRGSSSVRIFAKLRRLVGRARPNVRELHLLHSLVRLMQREDPDERS